MAETVSMTVRISDIEWGRRVRACARLDSLSGADACARVPAKTQGTGDDRAPIARARMSSRHMYTSWSGGGLPEGKKWFLAHFTT